MNTILNYYISNMFYTLSHIQSQLIKQNPKMSSQTAPSNPTINPYQYLQIVYNADSTFTSHWKIPSTPPSPNPNRPTPILSKDIPLNQSNKNWARIFLPRQALDNSSSSKQLLKVYFHGGGFILYSASSTIFHDLCTNIVVNIHAIIVSIDYRLVFLFTELEGRFFGHGTLDMEFKEKRNLRGWRWRRRKEEREGSDWLVKSRGELSFF